MKSILSHRKNYYIIAYEIISSGFSSWSNIETLKSKREHTNVKPIVHHRHSHLRKRWFADTFKHENITRTNILNIILLKIKSINNGTR
jgi:hypothetical protein